jgi:hypothetical protein
MTRVFAPNTRVKTPQNAIFFNRVCRYSWRGCVFRLAGIGCATRVVVRIAFCVVRAKHAIRITHDAIRYEHRNRNPRRAGAATVKLPQIYPPFTRLWRGGGLESHPIASPGSPG